VPDVEVTLIDALEDGERIADEVEQREAFFPAVFHLLELSKGARLEADRLRVEAEFLCCRADARSRVVPPYPPHHSHPPHPPHSRRQGRMTAHRHPGHRFDEELVGTTLRLQDVRHDRNSP